MRRCQCRSIAVSDIWQGMSLDGLWFNIHRLIYHLSVIIDAIKESRKIFQRMNSYAIYRIAETLRVLLFMTLAILVFNFYPLTAVMIVMLALLNDAAILSKVGDASS